MQTKFDQAFSRLAIVIVVAAFIIAVSMMAIAWYQFEAVLEGANASVGIPANSFSSQSEEDGADSDSQYGEALYELDEESEEVEY